MPTEVDEQKDDPIKRALLARRLRLLTEKRDLARANGLLYYQPYGKQDNFHAAGSNKWRLWEAGNRSGKSTAGIAEDCAYLVGRREWYERPFDVRSSDGTVLRHHAGYAGHPFATAGIPQRSVKLLVITTDWDKVDEIFTSERGEQGKLWRMLPRGMVKSKRRNHSGAIDMVELTNGSVLRFDTVKSWLSNPAGSESSDWDAIHVDEPCPQKMWTAASRGLIDRGGGAWFTLTPLDQPWIHSMFFPARNRDDHLALNGEKWGQRSSTDENLYLNKEGVEAFKAGLTREEVQCRIHGLPLSLTGLVYKEFDFDRHVLNKFPTGWTSYFNPPANWTIYVQIDPHLQLPQAVLFLAVGPHDQCVLFDEIWEECLVGDLAHRINARLQGRFCTWVGIDPYAYNPDVITGRTMADDMQLNGLYLSKASKDKQRGIMTVRQWLNTPSKLSINPRLTRTIFEFENYVYDKENKPADKDDHMMENLYRLTLTEPRFVDQENPATAFNDTTSFIEKDEAVFRSDILDLD